MKRYILTFEIVSLLISIITGCGNANIIGSDVKTTTSTTENASNKDYTPEEASPVSDFEYKENEEGGITITKYKGTDKNVVIPDIIDHKTVTIIGRLSFSENINILTVKMSYNVTKIEPGAFRYCSELVSIRLSNKLEIIDAGAFTACQKLSDITLPDSLYYIGNKSLSSCKSLKHITIPANCFGDYQFDTDYYYNPGSEKGSCFINSGLESIEIKEGVQFIPECAFSGTSIREINIPSSVTAIRKQAFSNCSKLEKVTLNDGLDTIDAYSFENTQITALVIPASVKHFGVLSIANANQISKLYFEANLRMEASSPWV